MNFIEQKDSYFIWILAPFLDTTDPSLQFYYDYTESKKEYAKAFAEIGCRWEWLNVRIGEVDAAIERIKNQKELTNVVINLCDGDEINEVPGVSVIEALEQHELPYTGAKEHFYRITTSKIPMKEAFDANGVPTAPWKVIEGARTPTNLFEEIGPVLIVKPAISAGSMGLGIRNVVTNQAELEAILTEMRDGYHGWNVNAGGIFIEAFIQGREFTSFVVGSASSPENIHVYPPVERVFHHSLPARERFLSFDRLWSLFDKEQPIANDGNLYDYHAVPPSLVPQLNQISLDAFKSVGGSGYGRLDIRMDEHTGKMYVLEVNAQCGLSEDEDHTSIGAILRFDKKSFTYLTIEIIEDALMCHDQKVKTLNL
jgi:D-alanine-D-alanine ligase